MAGIAEADDLFAAPKAQQAAPPKQTMQSTIAPQQQTKHMTITTMMRVARAFRASHVSVSPHFSFTVQPASQAEQAIVAEGVVTTSPVVTLTGLQVWIG